MIEISSSFSSLSFVKASKSECKISRCCFLSDSSTSVTRYWAKYKTLSRFLGERSSSSPSRLGVPFENHMWATGAARSIWPILSRLTLDRATSTPHLSQVTPLNLIFLYLPQKHSQSLVGPKIRSQNSPSFSGLRVL